MSRRPLAPDDRVLWEKVTRTVRPRKGAAIPSLLDQAIAETSAGKSELATPAKSTGKAIGPSAKPAPRPDLPSWRAPSDPFIPPQTSHAIDQPMRRKIARGRLPIEGRIDLHGLTQDQAHTMLRGFITSARARGMRTVMVITGKGSSPASDGVLRRMVPLWLRQSDLRDQVSGFSAAERGHGGEGALYVRLKRVNDRPI